MKLVNKYIITDGGVILFPEAISHANVAYGIEEGNQIVYAAGFCIINYGCQGVSTVRVYGEAKSINMKPGKRDDEIIREHFNPVSDIKYNLKTIKSFYE